MFFFLFFLLCFFFCFFFKFFFFFFFFLPIFFFFCFFCCVFFFVCDSSLFFSSLSISPLSLSGIVRNHCVCQCYFGLVIAHVRFMLGLTVEKQSRLSRLVSPDRTYPFFFLME